MDSPYRNNSGSSSSGSTASQAAAAAASRRRGRTTSDMNGLSASVGTTYGGVRRTGSRGGRGVTGGRLLPELPRVGGVIDRESRFAIAFAKQSNLI